MRTGPAIATSPSPVHADFEDLHNRVNAELSRWWLAATSTGPVDVVDMFSGAGGMSAGFRAVNSVVPLYRHAFACDIEPDANSTYERNMGIRPADADVSELAVDLKRWRGVLDQTREPGSPLVLIGCAPCQGFSSHRNAAGSSDPRNTLFGDFITLALDAEPEFILVENVPEILTFRHWPYVEDGCRRLREAGYYVHVGVHNMAAFGVAQERFRALVMAAKSPFHVPIGHVQRDEYRTVRQAIGGLPAIAPGAVGTDPMHYSAGHKPSTLETIRTVAKDGGSRPALAGPESLRRLAARQGKTAYEDIYGRLWWDRPSITITASSRNPASGRFVHPEQDRGLTVREAALLQGFPDGYHFVGGLDSAFQQVGNAVPPLFAAHLALTVAQSMMQPPASPPSAGIASPIGASFSRLIPALKAGTRQLSS